MFINEGYIKMIFGNDFIGGGNYLDVIKETFEEGRAIGILISADGWKAKNAWRAINKACKFGGCPVIKVISRWEDSHQFSDDHILRAVKHLKKLIKISNEYPEQKFYYNPWLEYRAREEDVKTLYRKLKKKLRDCDNITLVFNPESLVYSYPTKDDVILDLHNQHFQFVEGVRQIFSFDGQSSVDSDITKVLEKTKNCEAVFLWVEEYNGYKDSKHKLPRPERKDYPTVKLIKSVNYQVDNKKNETNFPKDMLFKTHSERENKLVVQIKNKGDYIYLKKGKKTVAQSEKGYYSDTNKAYIYRFNEMGIDIKPDLVDVYLDNIKLGSINPKFRDGYYRF